MRLVADVCSCSYGGVCCVVQVSYFYVDPDQTSKDPQTAALLHTFITYILSDEGQVRTACAHA